MNVIKHITTTVNVFQVVVITADQPVYAVAKYVQWKYPDLYGENKIVLMMGGLHIEMAVQNLVGKWLSGSGWTAVLKFLKFQSCPEISTCPEILVCENVLNFALAVTLHYIKTFLVCSLLYEHKRITMDIK